MRKVKVVIYTVVTFLTISFSLLFLPSCKDPCKALSCQNNGICRDGRCKCASGYEGVHCENKAYEKFIGTYDGTFRCNGGIPTTINFIAAPGADAKSIKVYDIFNQGTIIEGTIDLEKIDIPSQTSNSILFKGNGYIENNNSITLFIQQTIASNPVQTCVYNGTKL